MRRRRSEDWASGGADGREEDGVRWAGGGSGGAGARSHWSEWASGPRGGAG